MAILEEHGFRAAMEVLHTAQPDPSIQARQFQENAGGWLLQKMPYGGMRPTTVGIAFTALARFLPETPDEMQDVIFDMATSRRLLTKPPTTQLMPSS